MAYSSLTSPVSRLRLVTETASALNGPIGATSKRPAPASLTARRNVGPALGSDGTDRGLTFGGPPSEFAELVGRYGAAGLDEVILVFRHPFDLETIERIGEVREALADR